MIMYQDLERQETAAEKVEALQRLAAAGDTLAFLVEMGELEQAVLDARAPHADGWGPLEARLRAAMLAAGRAFLERARPGAARAALERALEQVCALGRALPGRLAVRPPEGYVHYALDPAAYGAAAARYLVDEGERARRAVVLGVRTIGTSLSAVVAATLGAEASVTIRPRGRTGERQVVADPALARRVLAWLEAGGDALVVDEGPGVTGETFQTVAAWLCALGLPADRLVLFPSRSWGIVIAPPERIEWFAAARKYAPPLQDDRPGRVAAAFGLGELRNLSAGAWREIVPGAGDQPAIAGRERLKYHARDAAGGEWVLRYVGLARWGEAIVERARALARVGLGAPPEGFMDGFLVQRWVPGSPLAGGEPRDARFLAALEDYLAGRAPLFRTGRPAAVAPVVAMLRENTESALGAEAPGLAAAARRLERLPQREAVVTDAKLQAREWLRHDGRIRKVDALDHGHGIWFPGPTDFAWDLAGAAVEHALPGPALTRLVARCAAAGGESAAELEEAERAYRPAYAAYAFGEALLSSWEAPEADRRRLACEAERYRRALADALRAA